MIPCYVSGAGMFAGAATHRFKTKVIGWLEESGLGYDTRYRYYRGQFPELVPARLARLVCDPIEYYDKEWPQYRARGRAPEDVLLTQFVTARDARFRAEAQAAIYCFDEAGLGSGINIMRFLRAQTPLLGFYAGDPAKRRINMTNVLQLEQEFPQQVRLAAYETAEDITGRLGDWLPMLAQKAPR